MQLFQTQATFGCLSISIGETMFPIIWLASQLESVNRIIVEHHMTRQEILAWMNHYGVTDILYDEHRLYQSDSGIATKFWFASDNQILIDKREVFWS
jgi:hypothetical protein